MTVHRSAVLRSYAVSALAYAAIGGVSAAIEWTAFYGLVETMHLHVVQAAIVSFVLATAANFGFSRSIGFLSRGRRLWTELGLVYAVSGAALLANLTVMMILIDAAGASAMPAKMAGTGAAFVLNYGLRQFFIFDTRPRWHWRTVRDGTAVLAGTAARLVLRSRT